eukprot:s680_g6.t1
MRCRWAAGRNSRSMPYKLTTNYKQTSRILQNVPVFFLECLTCIVHTSDCQQAELRMLPQLFGRSAGEVPEEERDHRRQILATKAEKRHESNYPLR